MTIAELAPRGIAIWVTARDHEQAADMTEDWKIVHSEPASGGASLEAITLNFYRAPRRYTVQNRLTGERRKVVAQDHDDLRRKIAAGQFAKN